MSAAFVTSRLRGVTRAFRGVKGRRVAAYTRAAPLLTASSTSARPMPRLAPVTRTVLPAIFICRLLQLCWVVRLDSLSVRRREARDFIAGGPRGCLPSGRGRADAARVGRSRTSWHPCLFRNGRPMKTDWSRRHSCQVSSQGPRKRGSSTSPSDLLAFDVRELITNVQTQGERAGARCGPHALADRRRRWRIAGSRRRHHGRAQDRDA